MTELKKIERMTFYEYTLKMTAFQLKMVDEDYALHKAAWLAQQVKATKKWAKKCGRITHHLKNFMTMRNVKEWC